VSAAYDEHNRRHRRLSILLCLLAAAEYRANDSLLTTVVNEFGIVSTRDQVRGELHWLKDQGYVTVREVSNALVATMTEAGSDVATGRRFDQGVAKPSPPKA
jgi:hypothetical protein